MDATTIDHYSRNAKALADRYESADMSAVHELMLRFLPAKCSVLELGCGSGRDAAFLVEHGYDLTAVDASRQMVESCMAYHPELRDRVLVRSIPLQESDSLLQRQYDAIVCIAAIMHIPDQELFQVLCQMRDLLKPGGILLLSGSIGRAGVENNRDPEGRLFVERPSIQVQLILERLGVHLIHRRDNKDALRREMGWYTLIMEQLGSGRPRAIDEIETIINRDRKVATYKLALLRALCEIAQTQHFQVKWLDADMVAVPLGLVTERWLQYYWPLIEMDGEDGTVAMPQTQGMEVKNPISFREPMRQLIRAYRPHGGLDAFHHDYRAGTIPDPARPLADAALNKIAGTIVKGPVTYAGGALDDETSYFAFKGRMSAKGKCTGPQQTCASLGMILVQSSTWREMCLIGHWVAESLILRWAELTHRLSHKTVPVKEVVDRLLVRPEVDRDVQFVRSIYQNTPNLECVWSGSALSGKFEVDHTVPFSIWHNNDLWNLVPATSRVNSKKRDKLVTRTSLLASRDRIIRCWELLKANAGERFVTEISRSLLRGSYDPTNWKCPTFTGLIETVETLAVQRGLQRWEPE